MNEENLKKLTNDRDKFMRYAKMIEDKFDGPSAYFYIKVIGIIKSASNYDSLFEDELFMEYLYATLASWGMHRMDKNTRMADFDLFKKSIGDNKGLFNKLSKERLREANIENLKEEILKIFNSLRVMGREDAPKFVANAKTMHFLLPNLIPPMDKSHILYFFYGWDSKNKKGKIVKRCPNIKGEEEIYFWDILNKFREIADTLNLTQEDLKNEWDTSIPKIIDNAIIGFNLEKNS